MAIIVALATMAQVRLPIIVNDEPITAIDISFRQAYEFWSANVGKLPPNALANGCVAARKQSSFGVEQRLIEEALKRQEGKRRAISSRCGDAKKRSGCIAELASDVKMTSSQYESSLSECGIHINTAVEKYEADRAWEDVVDQLHAAEKEKSRDSISRIHFEGLRKSATIEIR